MDDSTAEIPLPPPLPADAAAGLRAIHVKADALSPQASLAEKVKAALSTRATGDLWRAEAILMGALRTAPQGRGARLLLAEILRQETRFEEARAIYRQLLAADRQDVDALIGMADTDWAQSRRPEAFAWLARGVTEGAQTVDGLVTIAHRYQDWKDYPHAEETAVRAIHLYPNDVDAQIQRASIQVESGELEPAGALLEDILKNHPDNGLAHRLLAVVLTNPAYPHQNVNRARMLLEKAVELNARDEAIYRVAAQIYRDQRLYRLAAQAYYALLSLDPTSPDGRYGLSQVYALLGKQDLSRAQRDLYTMLDKRQRCGHDLTEQAYNHSDRPEVHVALARFCESIGDYAGAVTQYQIAAWQAPHDAAPTAALQHLYTRLGWAKPGTRP
jgi:tetratricopeptide (TPR) repeat protein